MQPPHVAVDAWGKWHHIDKGRALTDDEIGFVVDPVMEWIAGQVR
jgi:hypothetical protein